MSRSYRNDRESSDKEIENSYKSLCDRFGRTGGFQLKVDSHNQFMIERINYHKCAVARYLLETKGIQLSFTDKCFRLNEIDILLIKKSEIDYCLKKSIR